MSNLAPVVMFVYDRLEHAKKSIHALKNNYLAKETSLYIYSDGSKNSKSADGVMKVREFINNISGFKKIFVIEREGNFGLANSLIDGITNVVNEHGKIIVLEDDLVTSRYFLNFMNNSLNMYEQDKQVATISGYIYPIEHLPESFFIKGVDSWGWATWKDRWALFEPNGETLLNELESKNLSREANFNNSFKYSDMLKQQIRGQNNSWAVRWYMSIFLQGKLTLYPGKTFVKNIGFGVDATHTKVNGDRYDGELNKMEETFNKLEILECNKSRKKVEDFYFSVKPSLLTRLFNFFNYSK